MTPASADTLPPRPLLVALHGWLLSGRLWQPLQQQLAPEWMLQAPDLPGFGKRPRPRGLQPNLASYGRWVAEHCLEQLAPGQGVVLLGHSLGGSIATHAAAALGERLQGLVQIAAGGGVYQPRPFRQVRRGGDRQHILDGAAHLHTHDVAVGVHAQGRAVESAHQRIAHAAQNGDRTDP